jgi:phosphopantothenoylcysteine decarboxylase/phosphopantothenate--cysteine ligase
MIEKSDVTPPATSPPLTGRRLTLAVTGSIAAYKAPAILRLLRKAGAVVEVVLSRAATEFVGVATFQGLNGKPPFSDPFDRARGGELHVDLAKQSELVLIAPASADLLARLAAGRADDLVAAIALSARCPVLVAPAMHPNMWSHPATQRNVETLRRDGRVRFVGPVDGEVASGDFGPGRMAEPEGIVAATQALLARPDLAGRHLVVTAGPTNEAIDPVRSLTNRSSGKMGFALAERARERGAEVTLIAGPVALPTPAGVRRIDIDTALALRTALWDTLGADLTRADALVMAAAVADYRPRLPSSTKLPRSGPLTLELEPNPDLLAELGHARKSARPVLVGFALETDDDERVVARAREKLLKKRVDLVVANHAAESLGRDDIRVHLVEKDATHALEAASKRDAADSILDWLVERFSEQPA